MNPKPLKTIFIVVFLTIFARPSLAIDPTLFGLLPEVQLMAISPSGKLIAYRKVGEKQDQIAIMSLAERKILYAIGLDDINPFRLEFIGEDLVYLLAYSVKFKANISSGYILNLQTRATHQILQPGDDVVIQTGLGRIVGLTADKKFAYMPAYINRSNSGSAAIDNRTSSVPVLDLLKVDLSKMSSVKTQYRGRTNTRDYFIDEKGDPLVVEEYGDNSDKHSIYSMLNGKHQLIFEENTNYRTKSFQGITADKKSLAFLMTNEKNKRKAYYQMSIHDGTITGPLNGSSDSDVAGVIIDFNRTALGLVYDGFYPKYEFFNQALNKRFADLAAKFPEQSVTLQSYSDDFKSLVIYIEGPNFAGDFFLSTEGKEPIFLVSARPKIPTEAINPIGKVSLTARDSVKIPTLLTIPKASIKNMKNLPTILLPHGGPESHDVIGFDWLAQALANQGYLVIQPQFRGSDGFGLEHSSAGRGQWGKKMQDDLTDSVKALIQKGFVDPKRVCIVGASYGGYAALAGAAFTPDLYRCAVSINGISDLKKMLRIDMLKYGSNSETAAYWNEQLGKSEMSNTDLDAVSPINAAENIKAPTLLIASSKDVIVDPTQSSAMKRAINRKEALAELVELDGDDHHLSKFVTRKKALETTLAFLQKHLN